MSSRLCSRPEGVPLLVDETAPTPVVMTYQAVRKGASATKIKERKKSRRLGDVEVMERGAYQLEVDSIVMIRSFNLLTVSVSSSLSILLT